MFSPLTVSRVFRGAAAPGLLRGWGRRGTLPNLPLWAREASPTPCLAPSLQPLSRGRRPRLAGLGSCDAQGPPRRPCEWAPLLGLGLPRGPRGLPRWARGDLSPALLGAASLSGPAQFGLFQVFPPGLWGAVPTAPRPNPP